jgi:nucleotide-binding universal stress UspA family protein
MVHVFRSILVPIDFDDPSLLALSFAKQLAADQDATLHLLHVATILPAFGDSDVAEDEHSPGEEKARAMLNEVTKQRHLTGVNYQIHTASAGPRALAKAIGRVAAEVNADVIILKTSGRKGLSRFILGNVAEEVVRTAPCPVLTLSPEGQEKVRGIGLSPERE